jgi:hypothetical protein
MGFLIDAEMSHIITHVAVYHGIIPLPVERSSVSGDANITESWIRYQELARPETEFLDINLTKYSSLLLYVIHSPFYWWILKKTIFFSGFKNPCKKSAKQANSSLFMNSILWNGKVRVENQTKNRD